jgi:hypothetical protein
VKAPDPCSYAEGDFEPYWRDLNVCRGAMHEAGHAVVAHRWNVLLKVTVYAEPRRNYDECDSASGGKVTYRPLTSPLLRCWMAQSGPIAELWVDDKCGDADDAPRYATALEQLLREDQTGLWSPDSVEAIIAKQMRELRPQVEALAAELARRINETGQDVTMTGAEVDEFLTLLLERKTVTGAEIEAALQ